MLARVLLAISLTGSAAAATEPSAAPPFKLHWSAPADCASETEIEQDTRRLLGASTAPPSSEPVEADARVTVAKKGFELRITVGQGDQARTRWLEAATCAELSHAAALIVALAVDPSLAFPEAAGNAGALVAPVPASSPCTEPVALPPTPAAPSGRLSSSSSASVCAKPIEPPPHRPRARHAVLTVGAGVAYGELPQPLPRPSLGAAYQESSHWLELSLGAAFASTGYRADGRGASFWQWAATPSYCYQTKVGPVRVGPCAVVELSLVKATGFGVTRPKTEHNAWLAPGLGLQASLGLGSGTELLLSADLRVIARRTRFELASEQVFRANLLVPALRLALAAGIF